MDRVGKDGADTSRAGGGGCEVSLRVARDCTDKKENKFFLIYKVIQNGAVAKSYMINGLLMYGEIFAHFSIYYEALPHI